MDSAAFAFLVSSFKSFKSSSTIPVATEMTDRNSLAPVRPTNA